MDRLIQLNALVGLIGGSGVASNPVSVSKVGKISWGFFAALALFVIRIPEHDLKPNLNTADSPSFSTLLTEDLKRKAHARGPQSNDCVQFFSGPASPAESFLRANGFGPLNGLFCLTVNLYSTFSLNDHHC
jgi:hypothetical protein